VPEFFVKDSIISEDVYTLGVYNGLSKNMGLGIFWPDLKISEMFVIGLEVLFSGDFANFFKSWS